MRIYPKIWVVVVLCLIGGCAASNKYAGRERMFRGVPEVRVCLVENCDGVVIRALDKFAISTEGIEIDDGGADAVISVLPTGSQSAIVRVNGNAVGRLNDIALVPREAETRFELNGSTYRDNLKIIVTTGGKLSVVNYTDIETYVKGTLSNEIGRKRTQEEFEAVKAQAVAARSHVLARIKTSGASAFDVYADTRDQIYTGYSAETQTTNRAVDDTKGLVVTYDDEVADCFYHSSCGGKTESVENVWQGRTRIPYLQSVDDEDGEEFCRAAPDFRWQEKWTRRQLEAIIRKDLSTANPEYSRAAVGPNMQLLDIEVTKRLDSGRIGELKITMGNKKEKREFTIYSDKVRWVLRRPPDGKRILRSSWFELELRRDKNKSITSIIASGKGNGHGVGMCQWGAIGMSRTGYEFEEILTHYYHGAQIVKAY